MRAIALILLAMMATALTAATVAAQPAPAPPYESPMRAQCTEEINKDAKWMAQIRSNIEDQLSLKWQERNTKYFVTNNKHVIIAYAAMWVLMVGFVVGMFLRQRTLATEITQLRDDLRRATDEE